MKTDNEQVKRHLTPALKFLWEEYIVELDADKKEVRKYLWDVVESEDIGKVIMELNIKKPENIAVELANWTLDQGSTDNISIIIIEVKN